MGFDGFPGIRRAGRIKPALGAEEWRQQQSIAIDQEYQQGFHRSITITQSYLQLNCINAGFVFQSRHDKQTAS